jgi:hypothetical protein
MDNREEYPYGYCKKGERFYDRKSGKRAERISWIAALKKNYLFAPFRFGGGCNKHVFEGWVKKCLVSQLIPPDIVLIDNATFHQ